MYSRRQTTNGFIVLASLLLFVACADDIPVTSPETAAPEEVAEPADLQSVVVSVTCTANVAEGKLSCGKVPVVDKETGLQRIIVGEQGTFVELVSEPTSVSYNPVTEKFVADVQVANRLGDGTGVGQQLGTPDETENTGVRVFFHTGPTVTGGTGSATVSNEDGMGTFTGVNQPYHEYDEILPPFFISAAKTWEFDVTNTVNTFEFQVYVEADVPHPDGFVQVTPERATIGIGGNVTIAASIRDDVNRLATGTVTFSSADPTIASVDPASGLVTGVGPGTVDIIASSSGSEADGVTKVMIPEAGFQIRLRFLTPVTATQRQAFENAANRWQSHLTADLADASAHSEGFPLCGGGPINEVIDDLVIRATLEPIDGPGLILGSAGPCLFRGNLLPGFGTMRFDTADLALLEGNGQLEDVILHEMGHVLGFGTLWGSIPGLRLGTGTADPRFTGGAAIAAYVGIGGAGAVCDPPTTNTVCVPLEGTGGPGTRDGHWREDPCATCQTTDFFGEELMTGFISGTRPLSVVSIDHFTDLGYPTVDNTGADAFTLNTTLQAPSTSGPKLELVDDIWLGPAYVIEEDGTLTQVLPDRR